MMVKQEQSQDALVEVKVLQVKEVEAGLCTEHTEKIGAML